MDSRHVLKSQGFPAASHAALARLNLSILRWFQLPDGGGPEGPGDSRPRFLLGGGSTLGSSGGSTLGGSSGGSTLGVCTAGAGEGMLGPGATRLSFILGASLFTESARARARARATSGLKMGR